MSAVFGKIWQCSTLYCQLRCSCDVSGNGDAESERAAAGPPSPDGCIPRRLVDTLPKHWGGAGSAAVAGQLDDKTNEHGALLRALEDGGCVPRLPAPVLRSVSATRTELPRES